MFLLPWLCCPHVSRPAALSEHSATANLPTAPGHFAIPLDHLSPRFRDTSSLTQGLTRRARSWSIRATTSLPRTPGPARASLRRRRRKGAFAWSGEARIGRRALWPRLTPPAAIIERAPNLRAYQAGLEPGALNPMGARLLYLYRNGRDTLYRIHGTSEWWTISKAASSGCIRMLSQTSSTSTPASSPARPWWSCRDGAHLTSWRAGSGC